MLNHIVNFPYRLLCRPRLPWSFRLDALVADPAPVAKILENLKADPSLYVRKSVANHLNDITKDHPAWVMDPTDAGSRERAFRLDRQARPAQPDQGGRPPRARGDRSRPCCRGDDRKFFRLAQKIRLGEHITLALNLTSTAKAAQKLVIDYAIHYVKKTGNASAKVFKWKEFRVAPGETVTFTKRQVVKDFTTRKHHPGLHRVEILVNGAVFAEGEFVLAT